MSAAMAKASASLLAMPPFGCSMFNSFRIALNLPLSSAASIESGDDVHHMCKH
jgi:hypothetical protein